MAGAHRLSPLDASFLHLETPNNHMHIGGVAIFEPSPLGSGEALYKGISALIETRLELMPRYRQKVAFIPLSLDIPVWVDDPDFNISNHVLHAAVPSPGGDHEIQDLVARLFSVQLDRGRPLWEMYVVEGLSGGRWALISKTHHSMVDGMSNLELATVLLDVEPTPSTSGMKVSRWEPPSGPSALELLIQSMADRLKRPGKLLNAAKAVMENPRGLADSLRDTASGLAVTARTVRTDKSVLNGSIGPSRVYTYRRASLEDFRLVKSTFGGTINDVVLAAVTGGLREFLAIRGYDPDEESLQALCPVSIRDASEKSALGNRLAMMLVKLPLKQKDPVKRLEKVRATVDHLKARKQAVGADFLLKLAGFAPSTLHAMVARSAIGQVGFNLVVTNVPGPQFPLYCQGSRLMEAFPVAFLYDGQQVAIAIFSYCGYLNFGYIGDKKGMADMELLADCVDKGLRELVAAAHRKAAPPQPEPAKFAIKKTPPKTPKSTRATHKVTAGASS